MPRTPETLAPPLNDDDDCDNDDDDDDDDDDDGCSASFIHSFIHSFNINCRGVPRTLFWNEYNFRHRQRPQY